MLRRCVRSNPAAVGGGVFQKFVQSYSSSAGVAVTKLSNGVTVASIDNGSQASAVGAYVAAGSSTESFDNMGAANFLKHMAYRSTNSLSALRLTRLIEALSSSFTVSAQREVISYSMETLRSQVPGAVTVLADMMRPRLPEWEVRDTRSQVVDSVHANQQDPDVVLNELIHEAAFRGVGLGRPSLTTDTSSISHEVLAEYVQNNYVGNKITLVGVGVDHETLVGEAKKTFEELPAGEAPQPSADYAGGEKLEYGANGSRVAVGFFAPARSDANAPHFMALARLLGYGVQNKGTPGFGLSSRLNRNVVEKNNNVRAANAIYTGYKNAGLFRLTANAATGEGAAATELIVNELKAVANGVTKEEAAKASALLSRDAAQYFDNRLNLLNYLGAGETADPATFVNLTSSPADLQGAAKALLASEISVAAYGDYAGVPSPAQLK